jgi:hypothetical protein
LIHINSDGSMLSDPHAVLIDTGLTNMMLEAADAPQKGEVTWTPLRMVPRGR